MFRKLKKKLDEKQRKTKGTQRTSEIFFPREYKLHMFICNFLFITYIDMSVSKIKKKTRRKTKENQRNAANE